MLLFIHNNPNQHAGSMQAFESFDSNSDVNENDIYSKILAEIEEMVKKLMTSTATQAAVSIASTPPPLNSPKNIDYIQWYVDFIRPKIIAQIIAQLDKTNKKIYADNFLANIKTINNEMRLIAEKEKNYITFYYSYMELIRQNKPIQLKIVQSDIVNKNSTFLANKQDTLLNNMTKKVIETNIDLDKLTADEKSKLQALYIK